MTMLSAKGYSQADAHGFHRGRCQTRRIAARRPVVHHGLPDWLQFAAETRPGMERAAMRGYGQHILGAFRGAGGGRAPRSVGGSTLAVGWDALSARLALADTAERCLDVQYYIWKPDTAGRLLAERLLRAADRGVRVRVLLDDFGGSASDTALLALDGHTNIEVRLFQSHCQPLLPPDERAFRFPAGQPAHAQ